MKILTVVGARPQFVKAAVVSRALQEISQLTEVMLHTGQHFDDNMSTIFFDELDIPRPHYHLGIGGGSHGSNTGRILEAVEEAILEENPDFVMVYGDTDSTLAGALAAVKLCIPVAHVEAGLRSFNRRMPEEINRIMTDHISEVLFTPTEEAVRQLAKEGIVGSMVDNVGDVMLDAIRIFNPIAERKSNIMATLQLSPRSYALCTLHRKENTDNPARLAAIIEGMKKSGLTVILPLHPRTKKMLSEHEIDCSGNIRIVDPVGYFDMLMLQRNAKVIGTDSGGLQKEAYFQSVPCVTFRDETEWRELVSLGVNRLVGADADAIAREMTSATPVSYVQNVYGDGDASQKIAARFAQDEAA